MSAENEEEHNEYYLREDMASLVFDATYMRNSSIPRDGQGFASNSEFESGAANPEVHRDLQKLMEAVDAELYPGCQTFKKLECISHSCIFRSLIGGVTNHFNHYLRHSTRHLIMLMAVQKVHMKLQSQNLWPVLLV